MGKMLRQPLVLALLAGLSYLVTTAMVLRVRWARLSEPASAASASGPKKPSLITVGSRPWDFWSAETEEMISELSRERARLDERAHDLDTLKTRLDGEKAELDRLRDQITQSRQELEHATTELGEEETKNLRPLAQTYSRLTPRATVAIFRELDDATALKILALMKTDAVSVIFEEMARTSDQNGTLATRAAALTEKLRLLKKTQANASVAAASSAP